MSPGTYGVNIFDFSCDFETDSAAANEDDLLGVMDFFAPGGDVVGGRIFVVGERYRAGPYRARGQSEEVVRDGFTTLEGKDTTLTFLVGGDGCNESRYLGAVAVDEQLVVRQESLLLKFSNRVHVNTGTTNHVNIVSTRTDEDEVIL